MAKEKLTDTVSVQEMLNMREIERLGNKEIAARLGSTPATIRKYIGDTPKDITNEARLRARGLTERQNAKRRTTETIKSLQKIKYLPPYSAKDWQESTTIHKLSGFYANYEVNSTTSETEITFIDGHSLGKLNKADLMKLIDEFSRVASILER